MLLMFVKTLTQRTQTSSLKNTPAKHLMFLETSTCFVEIIFAMVIRQNFRNSKGQVLPFVVIQYYFVGGVEVPVKCAEKPCRKAVEECFPEEGGTSAMSSLTNVPRDCKQVYNLTNKLTTKKFSWENRVSRQRSVMNFTTC